jgi:FkbM family methyltransferase
MRISPKEWYGEDSAPVPLLLRILVHAPWTLKFWILTRPVAWRVYAGVCRRVGWNGASLGWHQAANGPYAAIRLRASHVNHLWLPMGGYEPWVSKWIVRLLADDEWGCRSGAVWDVGANRGYISLLCASHGASRVLSLEPDKDNRRDLDAHLQANPALARKIEVLDAAAGDADGEVELVRGEAGAESQIVRDGVSLWGAGQTTQSGRSPLVRLDSLLQQGRPGPRLLKVDVEGAEALVLQGARLLLERVRPVVLLEVHNKTTCRACTEQLEGLGYRVHQIVRNRLQPLGERAISYGHLLALESS